MIATPVPTHYPLAKAALEAGKHVFVEKPPAMRAAEMEELIGLAEARGLVLMPGHLLLYHPGAQKLKELVDEGELGDVLVVYGNRQNLGKIRKDENALWSLGVHDLSVILYLIQEEIVEAAAHGHAFLNEGVEDVVFCYLRFASGKIAHMHLSWLDPHKMRRLTVVGRDKMAVFDDMELDRKITVYDKAPEEPSDTYGEWRTRTGDTFSPKLSNAEPLKLECQHFVRLVQEGWDGREKMAVFDDMELERKVTVYEKAPWKQVETYGEWQTRSGDIWIPKIATDEPLRLECAHFLELIEGGGDRARVARDGARVVRALEMLTNSLNG